MPSNKKHRKHGKRSHDTTDSLSDIIPMSNDDSIKSNNELDDYHDSVSDNDDNDPTDDDYSDDPTDDDDYSDYDDTPKRHNKYDRKGRRHHEHEDDDFNVATIKPKHAKPARHSKISVDGITEVERSKGVQQLSNKLNNNLHQIQIALPYGQTPQVIPSNAANEGYALTEQTKKRLPFWRKRWFGLTMKVFISVCVFICVGIFIYKYLKMVEELNKRHNLFNDENEEEVIKGDKNTDVLTEPASDSSNASSSSMSGGNDASNIDHEIEEQYTLSDNTYNSLGKTNLSSTRRSINCRRARHVLPKRDARGRFIKQNK